MVFEKALIQDKEESTRELLGKHLEQMGIETVLIKQIEDIPSQKGFDLVFCEATSLDNKEHFASAIIIILTTAQELDTAVRKGAFHYLIKPFSKQMVESLLEKAIEHRKLLEERSFLRAEITKSEHFPKHHLIAASSLMQEIVKTVEKVAKSSSSVFISGESGTGKEVIARALHAHSLRKDEPFITVNCAAIPDTLLESEFFGHEKGAFTGAFTRRIGRFEMAHQGTLFLDEISEISPELQAKLLRAVQEQEFERVGGNKTLKVDIRFIASSNRNLKQCVEEKTFREDLYYRLNVVPIHLPPLRDRKEDVLPLAEYFLDKLCQRARKTRPQLSDEAKKILLDYPWHGNVRELANIMERAVVMSASDHILSEDLNLDLKSKSCPLVNPASEEEFPLMTLSEMENRLIGKVIEACKGNKTKAAEVLGINVRTLRYKLNRLKAPL